MKPKPRLRDSQQSASHPDRTEMRRVAWGFVTTGLICVVSGVGILLQQPGLTLFQAIMPLALAIWGTSISMVVVAVTTEVASYEIAVAASAALLGLVSGFILLFLPAVTVTVATLIYGSLILISAVLDIVLLEPRYPRLIQSRWLRGGYSTAMVIVILIWRPDNSSQLGWFTTLHLVPIGLMVLIPAFCELRRTARPVRLRWPLRRR